MRLTPRARNPVELTWSVIEPRSRAIRSPSFWSVVSSRSLAPFLSFGPRAVRMCRSAPVSKVVSSTSSAYRRLAGSLGDSTRRAARLTAKLITCAGRPTFFLPSIAAASMTDRSSGGVYCTMMVPRPLASRQTNVRSASSVATRSAAAPRMSHGACVTIQESSGLGGRVKVPGVKPTAMVMFSPGTRSREVAVSTVPAASVLVSMAHGSSPP